MFQRLLVGDAAAHMAGRHMAGRVAHMAGLVVKEEVRLELAQEGTLGQATEEHGLVHIDFPVHQRVQRTLMGRGAACRDQGRAYAHAGHLHLLQSVQRRQQRLERPFGQGQGSFFQLVLLKGFQSLGLEHTLGLVKDYVWRNASQNFHFRGK